MLLISADEDSKTKTPYDLRLTLLNDCSTPEDGTDIPYRKVGEQPQTYAALYLGQAKVSTA